MTLSKLTPFEQRILEENRQLRDEVRAMVVRPLPDVDLPGYDIWRALMEDARERGEVRLTVRHQDQVEVVWEPA